jgi:UDP-4-amino-4,6-dideoxy-N-acetyl-beta-L-altrosamine transaminase
MQTDSKVAGRLQSSLALEGGKPVRDSWLPYGHQLIDQADITAVTEALKSDFLTQGPRIKQFEDSIAKAVGVKYAVAISNGTAALHAAYYSAGITSGDLIITAPITFAATSNAALYLGARPLFADVDPSTGLIDVDSVAKLLKSSEGKKVKAVVGIDFAGQPCHYRELETLAANHGIPFIVDAAHSLGATYQGQKAGFAGILSTMSFHPVKSITTGEGGVILTNDDKLNDKLLLFRSHGITKAKDKLTRDEGPWYHEMQELGYNYRMCDIQAALGTSQMAKLPDFVKRRREIATLYRTKLANHPHYQCATAHDDRESAYHLFPILVKDTLYAINRRYVFEALHAENIGVQVHYIPTYQMPYYQNEVNDRDWASLCPGAEEFYQREIGLPIFPAMTDSDVDDVVKALNKIASHLPK